MTGRLLLLSLAALRLAGQQVEGRVTDAVTGEALGRVTVSVLGSPARATTGADGRFVLADLAPGEQVLQAATVGYLPAK